MSYFDYKLDNYNCRHYFDVVSMYTDPTITSNITSNTSTRYLKCYKISDNKFYFYPGRIYDAVSDIVIILPRRVDGNISVKFIIQDFLTTYCSVDLDVNYPGNFRIAIKDFTRDNQLNLNTNYNIYGMIKFEVTLDCDIGDIINDMHLESTNYYYSRDIRSSDKQIISYQ